MTSPAVDFSFHGGAPLSVPRTDGGDREFNFDDTFFSGGPPAAEQEIDGGDREFEFEFSSQFERAHLSTADDLFSGGKIKPLIEPPPGIIFSLRDSIKQRIERKKQERELLRERKRGNGSISPLRVCDILVDGKSEISQTSPNTESKRSKFFSSKSFSFSSPHKKWKLKDLLLFRSSSEGRSPKYSALNKKGKELDEKSLFSRSMESEGVAVEGRRRKRPAVEVRWKTTLPYKHGLLAGCLGGPR